MMKSRQDGRYALRVGVLDIQKRCGYPTFIEVCDLEGVGRESG